MRILNREYRTRNRWYNTHKSGSGSLICLFCLLFVVHWLIFTVSVYAQDDMIRFIEKKQKEIKEKESTLLKEEERLKVLRKDIDERIEKYARLLNQLENILKKLEQVQDDKFEHVVKSYEVMPPEEAAERLSALPEQTAVKIIRKMKPKKAGAVMAFIDSKKVASLTEIMTKFEKKFPTE